MMKKNNLFSNICNSPYGNTRKFKLFDAAKNSREFVQKMQLQRKIPVHSGCVNSICWNETGSHILSGSDDQRLAVVNGYDYSVSALVDTGHLANIFSAKFLPCTNDTNVVSCSGDGIIIYSDLNRPSTSLENKFVCHRGTAYEIMTVPNDPNTFLSCGEDRTVRWFDVRTKTSCRKDECKEDVLINCQAPVTSLAVNPHTPYHLGIGSADASVRIFDRRMLTTAVTGLRASNGFQALVTCFTVPEFEQSRRITSLCYSPDGHEMLVSYSSDYIYLFDVKDNRESNPKIFSKDKPSTSSELSNIDSNPGLFFNARPLMKRLRIRGDWSDTGPNARPESEAREVLPEAASRNSIVRTMTDILTRMFNTSGQNASRSEASRSTPGSSHGSSSEDINATGASDEDREERPIAAAIDASQSMDIENSETNASAESNLPERATTDSQEEELSSQNVESNDDNRANLPSITCSAFDDEASSSNMDTADKENIEAAVVTENGLSDQKRSIDITKVTISDNDQNPSSDTTDISYDEIERSIESRRNDLIERHHQEPMVNLHYSGQSVSSGLITMDIANSSTPNERQWLEQTASDLADLPISHEASQSQVSGTSESNPSGSQPASSDSETEAAVQTIQPNENLLDLQDGPDRPLTFTERADAAEDELELMVEVDSCSWDSDEENQRGARGSPSNRNRRTRCDKHSDDFMCSLNAKVKAANDELKREEITMKNVAQPRIKRKYTGHRNARTMIKESTFWGDNFIMSGSDCGHIFVWDRYTTELVMLMEADHHVVNCLQPHPFDPILASSGIDYDIKLWAPTREEPLFDVEKANEIIKRNEVMLEETKDTITVPASFMFRMFTSLSNFRTGRAYRWSRAAREMREARERENADSNRR